MVRERHVCRDGEASRGRRYQEEWFHVVLRSLPLIRWLVTAFAAFLAAPALATADEGESMDAYQALGEIVLSHCPDGFQRAVLSGELDEDWAEVRITCLVSRADPIYPDLDATTVVEVHRRLNDIREEMAQVSGERWRTCAFTITSDGQFNMEVQY